MVVMLVRKKWSPIPKKPNLCDMNSRDRTNLDFLMNIPAEEFDAWLLQASDDDVDYAIEIIRKSKAEVILETIELEEVMYSYEEDMAEANEVIQRIKNA